MEDGEQEQEHISKELKISHSQIYDKLLQLEDVEADDPSRSIQSRSRIAPSPPSPGFTSFRNMQYMAKQTALKAETSRLRMTPSDLGDFGPSHENVFNEKRSLTSLQVRKANFPGLPFAPGKFYISEYLTVQRQVVAEFVDFLTCLTDLLKLLHVVKSRHLKSSRPFPPQVVREVCNFPLGKTGSRMAAFEDSMIFSTGRTPESATSAAQSGVRSAQSMGVTFRHSKLQKDTLTQNTRLPHSKPSINASPQSKQSPQSKLILKASSQSKHSLKSASQSKHSLKSTSQSKHYLDASSQSKHFLNVSPASGSAAEILFGKKVTPIWQVVEAGVEEKNQLKQKILQDHKKSLISRTRKKGVMEELREVLKPRPDLQTSRSHHLAKSIRYSKTNKVKPTNETFQKQMEMFEAYFNGFSSVEAFAEYLDQCYPHWFKDLFQESLDLGMVITKDVVDCFHILGQFYYTEFDAMYAPRAKCCFIVQSLPFWDISRSTVQRGLDFILRKILKTPYVDTDLSRWLGVRRIDRLVVPPLPPPTKTVTEHFMEGKSYDIPKKLTSASQNRSTFAKYEGKQFRETRSEFRARAKRIEEARYAAEKRLDESDERIPAVQQTDTSKTILKESRDKSRGVEIKKSISISEDIAGLTLERKGSSSRRVVLSGVEGGGGGGRDGRRGRARSSSTLLEQTSNEETKRVSSLNQHGMSKIRGQSIVGQTIKEESVVSSK